MNDLLELWVEKYRPQCLDDVVIDQETKTLLKSYISKQSIPNLLFHGTQGRGKTTLGKVLIKELDASYLYINGAIENGIDTVRTKIREFTNSVALGGGIKIVFIDEASELSGGGMCLDAETEIEIILNNKKQIIKLKDLEKNKIYEIESFNFDTQLIEKDFCNVVCDDEKECFEVELENGEKIICTGEHKFFNENGIEVCLNQLKEGNKILSK